MSLILERVRKAIERYGTLDPGVLRATPEEKVPVRLASDADLAARHQFLLQTSESPAEGQVAYERIIQGNELQDVNYLARGSRAARAIGRVWMREGNGRLEGYGTGFLISGSVLITNNHVLPSEAAAARSEVEFEYERDEWGRELPGVKFSLDPGALFHTHPGLDFSVVAVAPRASNADRKLTEFGHLPLIGGTGKAAEGEWLTIIQHPGGELKQLCARENQLLKKAADVIWYSTDTQGGSSGSPVFNNDWLVVAVHHSGVPEIKNGRWQTIDGQDYDERRHREADIKWVANEGIRVSRIVETLRAQLEVHPLIAAVLQAAPPEFSVPSKIVPTTPVNPMNAPNLVPANASLAGRQYLVRFDAAGNPSMTSWSGGPAESSRLAFERSQPTASRRTEATGVTFKFDYKYEKRKGFAVDFLGNDKHQINLPTLKPSLAVNVVKLLEPQPGNDHVLHYTNLSVVMHAKRKFAIYTAANVDFANRYAGLKSKRVWRYDPRISEDYQVGDEAYAGNQFDRGHLTRQEDMEFGSTMAKALQSTADTCHWTNCTLQHKNFNGLSYMWQNLERHILEYSVDPEDGKGFRAQIFTGPVFKKNDPEYAEIPGVRAPMKFWKVCVAVTSSGKLFAVAYLADQSRIIKKWGIEEAAGETPFEPYKLHQLPIAELQDMIQIEFTSGVTGQEVPLTNFDPLKNGVPPELDADEDGDDDRLERTGGGTGAEKGRINLLEHPPFFG